MVLGGDSCSWSSPRSATNDACIATLKRRPVRAEALAWPEIRQVLEDSKALGFEVVQLTGGDPLLSPHCIRAVELAREIGIPQVEIYTNGLALRGRTYERLRELAPWFAFSFYSHDAEVHDAITRTPGSHARTARAIRRAVEDGLRVRVGVISMEQNKHDATRTYEYLLKLGVADAAIRFDRMRDVGRGRSTSPELDAQPTRARTQSGGVEKESSGNFGGTAAVSYDGTVYPCIFSRHLPLGSVQEARLQAILRSAVPIPSGKRNLPLARTTWGEKLSCWECQTRSALLAGGSNA